MNVLSCGTCKKKKYPYSVMSSAPRVRQCLNLIYHRRPSPIAGPGWTFICRGHPPLHGSESSLFPPASTGPGQRVEGGRGPELPGGSGSGTRMITSEACPSHIVFSWDHVPYHSPALPQLHETTHRDARFRRDETFSGDRKSHRTHVSRSTVQLGFAGAVFRAAEPCSLPGLVMPFPWSQG